VGDTMGHWTSRGGVHLAAGHGEIQQQEPVEGVLLETAQLRGPQEARQ
jgi:hypothetical protein